MKIVALADLHISELSREQAAEVIKTASRAGEVLVIAGDITENGTLEEAGMFAQMVNEIKVPVIAVLGNHDYEQEQQDEIKDLLSQAEVKVLDGNSVEINGVGFAGTKGFGGGFDDLQLSPWGERAVKAFVNESVREMLKLESALNRLPNGKKVVITHYAPIKETVSGEPEAIHPFLGSSRLASPVNSLKAMVCFHGHAHHGCHQGKTSTGIPVYNVSLPVLKQAGIKTPYLIYEIDNDQTISTNNQAPINK